MVVDGRGSGTSGPSEVLPIAFRADLFDGPVNQLLEFVRGNVGEGCADFSDGVIKDPPTDGLLNEFREITLFHALGTQKGAQGMICLFGQCNGQAGGFWRGLGILGMQA